METISKDASLSSDRSDPARTLPRMALGFALLAGANGVDMTAPAIQVDTNDARWQDSRKAIKMH